MWNSLKEVNIRSKLIMLILLFIASVLCLALGAYIRDYTGRRIYMFLGWNMFLAWMPAGFALCLDYVYVRLRDPRVLRIMCFGGIGVLWLLFYPNAAYLITDQLHPFARFQIESRVKFWFEIEFWYHLLLFTSVAVIGLLLGIYSLYSVHELVRKSLGRIKGWMFAVLVLLLSSFGIYLGRFIRWNSWDAIQNPRHLASNMLLMFTDMDELRRMIPFTGIIFMITLMSYLIIYGFTTMRSQ